MATLASRSDEFPVIDFPGLNSGSQDAGGQQGTTPSSASTSPIETGTSSSRPPYFSSNTSLSLNAISPLNRLRTGSPSHDFGAKLFSKRAREIQVQEGIMPQIWAPPTSSGPTTPLREPPLASNNAPKNDSFPDFEPSTTPTPKKDPSPVGFVTGRHRAGTMPSTLSAPGTLTGLGAKSTLLPSTARPTPTSSPFQPGSALTSESLYGLSASGTGVAPGAGPTSNSSSSAAKSALLSRLRAGSMPQRANLLGGSTATNPFGSSIFSTNWASNHHVGDRDSPTRASFSKESLADADVRTLDYLGLVDSPQQPHHFHQQSLMGKSALAPSDIELLLEGQRALNNAHSAQIPGLAGLAKNANRFRSYSVNAKEKYEDEEDEFLEADGHFPASYVANVGSQPPDQAAAALAVHEAVRQHNLEVQAFASLTSTNRPRARTAGVLDAPSARLGRGYLPGSSRLDAAMAATNFGEASDGTDYEGLATAVQGLGLGVRSNAYGGTVDAFQDDSLLEGPTRALWLGNIPASTTVSTLNMIFSNFGAIESARILTHKNCGFVNFEKVESAVRARSQLNNTELFPGAGPVKIGYAKVPSAAGTPGDDGMISSGSPDPYSRDTGQRTSSALGLRIDARDASATNDFAADRSFTPPSLADMRNSIILMVKDLGATDEEQVVVTTLLDTALEHEDYRYEIPPVSEPNSSRIHDAPRLRDIRKRIDNNNCSQAEVEEIAMGMLSEIAELSSDYLGNTVIQKLFELCSEDVRGAMLAKIAPHMAEIGVHKNGTWAAQKIIDVAQSQKLVEMVIESLRPYAVPLFLDQFGNYVIQGCLKYQYPDNNFIFEAMLSRLWDLAQGRFGARAMRACLESHNATKDHQRAMAAAIALNSVQLATNANGALLLTWLLDTCTFPGRRAVLAPHLIPHLAQLCTHKVAYLTVLKIINQRNEPEARDLLFRALFFSPEDRVLEEILSDQTCGPTLIFKVLTSPFFDEKSRSEVVHNIRSVLVRVKAQPSQGYKRLMDEVGLTSRVGGGTPSAGRDGQGGSRPDNSRSMSAKLGGQHGSPQLSYEPHHNRAVFPTYDQGLALQRPTSVDSSSLESYMSMSALGTPMFATTASNIPARMAPNLQLRYQQAMLSRNGMHGAVMASPPSFYPAMDATAAIPGSVNGANSGFNSAMPSLASSVMLSGATQLGSMQPQGAFASPAASYGQPQIYGGPAVAGMAGGNGGMYGYPMPYVTQVQQHPQMMPQQQHQHSGNHQLHHHNHLQHPSAAHHVHQQVASPATAPQMQAAGGSRRGRVSYG